jgi:hypothetical protein
VAPFHDRTIFDGNWRAQELREAEYRKRFVTDEQEYTQVLHVLAAALKRMTVP